MVLGCNNLFILIYSLWYYLIWDEHAVLRISTRYVIYMYTALININIRKYTVITTLKYILVITNKTLTSTTCQVEIVYIIVVCQHNLFCYLPYCYINLSGAWGRFSLWHFHSFIHYLDFNNAILKEGECNTGCHCVYTFYQTHTGMSLINKRSRNF